MTLSALVTLCAVTHAAGQAGGAGAEFVLAPTVALKDIGWDDNVFHMSSSDHPIGDFTTTLSATIRPALRSGRFNISGRSQLDFIYFRKISHIRSIDADTGGRVELLLGRMTPYVEGNWASTRHRRNFEIDLPVRRIDSSWSVGVDVPLSGKTTVGVLTRRLSVDYKGDTIYLGADLAEFLGAGAVINGVTLRYALTPLTTVGVDAEKDRNDFPATGERNSDGYRVMSIVEFRPLSAVSGRASVGVRSRSFLDGNAPPFKGAVARVDLAWTLLGRTQLGVGTERDLSYSYRPDERDYLQTGLELSVAHRLSNAWEVGGTIGRFSLTYGLTDPVLQTSRDERVVNYGVSVGYHIERTTLGIQFGRQTRGSDFTAQRHYQSTRVGSFVNYNF